MWPFALLALACIPLMGFATSMEMKNFLGEDTGDDSADELNSPGGIVVETLLNMATVSALTLEEERYKNFEAALENDEPNYVREGIMQGFLAGLSMFIQQWINAVQFWFGGWILFNFPDKYVFNDFLIANFAILFSLFGLGAAFQDISDRKETEASASRIFYLLDRKSKIDPMSEEGKKLD
jgi:ABC-type bacteriocin/lantibiotic exporter with double-glycine peptidase domain